MLLARNANDHLVQMPDVVMAGRLTTQAARIFRPELLASSTNRLMGDHDAALQQHLLHEAKTQRKSEVQPDRMDNDLGREPMALVADGLGHAPTSNPEASDQELP